MSKKWIKEDDEFLVLNWPNNVERPAVAEQLGRSIGACTARMRKLNKMAADTNISAVEVFRTEDNKILVPVTETIDMVEHVPFDSDTPVVNKTAIKLVALLILSSAAIFWRYYQ
jgi:hypothetical protein